MKYIKHYLLILAVCVLIFIPLFIRPEVIGIYDQYYYLNFMNHKTDMGLNQSLPVIEWFFSILPTNLIIIKLIMFFMAFISGLIFYHTCRLYSEKYAIYGVLILLSFPFFAKQFLNFETSVFSLMFMFASLYFVHKYATKEIKTTEMFKSWIWDWDIILSLIFLFISVIFWRFTIYYIPIFLILTGFNFWYILAMLSVIPMAKEFFSYYVPDQTISECVSGKAIIPLAFLFPAFIPKFIALHNFYPTLLLLVITIIKFKYIYLLIPFVIINYVTMLSKLDNKAIKTITIILICVFLMGTTYYSVTSAPRQDTKQAIELAKSLTVDKNISINISWDLDYYAQWNGIETHYSGYFEPLKYEGYVLTYPNDPELEKRNCKEIKKQKEMWLFFC